jgi:hypothetical protein
VNRQAPGVLACAAIIKDPAEGVGWLFKEDRVVNRFIASSVIAAACLVAAPRSFAQERDAQAPATAKAAVNDDKHLVYADFEKVDDNKKPVSNRGGSIGLFPYQAQGSKEPTVAGPELVHIKKDDPNHLLKFDYALFAPTDWTGVVLEIHGQADVDGKLVPDDASGYKALSLDCYATGVPIIRVEIVSQGRGKENAIQAPQYTFKVKEGLNTYKIPLTGFSQPDWVKDERVDPKDILKALTSIKISAFCDQCQLPKQGMVILDNVVFEK